MSSLLNLWKWFKVILRAKKVHYWTKISKVCLEQHIAMLYNGQKWGNFKSHVQGVKWNINIKQSKGHFPKVTPLLKNSIIILIGQVVLELIIKIVFCLLWSILQNPLGLLKFKCNFLKILSMCTHLLIDWSVFCIMYTVLVPISISALDIKYWCLNALIFFLLIIIIGC